jgi:UDP-N-acetylglucosamine acyltransferase
MPNQIHPNALVDPSARLGEGVQVGAFSVIEAGVTIGDGCSIGHHVVLRSGVTMGAGNRVADHAVLGGDPQDLKYAGQATRLLIGDRNSIREFVTINRGTEEGGGVTRVGDDNLFMAYVHVAHDCTVGHHVVAANCATLAGHVEVGDHAVLGGLAAIQQYSRVGTGCMLGGMARVTKDVPPYSTTVGTDEIKVYGLNKVGLRRRGLGKADLEALEHAYRVYQDKRVNFSQAVEALEALQPKTEQIQVLIDFLKSSQRGTYR